MKIQHDHWVLVLEEMTGKKFFHLWVKSFDPSLKPGYVYVIQLGDTDHFKIGMSVNPNRRLKQLQSKCPIPLKIIYVWHGRQLPPAKAGGLSFQVSSHEGNGGAKSLHHNGRL